MSEPNPYDGDTIYDEARRYKQQFEVTYGKLDAANKRIKDLENFKEAVTEYFGSSRVASALDEWRDRNKVPF